MAQPAPQTFVLLPHLSEDPELQTGPSRCTPNSRLFITHCHKIIPKSPPPPTLLSTNVNVGAMSRHRALISISSNEAGSVSDSGSITTVPNNAATLLPSHHTPAKMAQGDQSDRQEQTDTWPCDFSVILESILSNFAICPGGKDGSGRAHLPSACFITAI